MYHPDAKHTSEEASEEKFKELNEAFEQVGVYAVVDAVDVDVVVVVVFALSEDKFKQLNEAFEQVGAVAIVFAVVDVVIANFLLLPFLCYLTTLLKLNRR